MFYLIPASPSRRLLDKKVSWKTGKLTFSPGRRGGVTRQDNETFSFLLANGQRFSPLRIVPTRVLYIYIKWRNLNEEMQTKRSNQRRISLLEAKIRGVRHLVFISRIYTDADYKSRNLVFRRKIVVTELYSCFEPRSGKRSYFLMNLPPALFRNFFLSSSSPLPFLFYLHE